MHLREGLLYEEGMTLPPALRPYADALEQFVRDVLDRAMSGVLTRLEGLERDQESTGKLVGVLVGRQRPVPEGAQVQVDEIWNCRKCGARLGFYDPKADILRVRYKEHLLHTRLGPDGWVRVMCRGCGEDNQLDYTPGDAGKTLVLSAEQLASLLTRAQSSPGKQVVIDLEK